MMTQQDYTKLFDSYSPAPTQAQIQETCQQYIQQLSPSDATAQTLGLLHSLLDITSLSATDTAESIAQMVEYVNQLDDTTEELPNVAAICVYPAFVQQVRELLTAGEVQVASVAGGFPASQATLDIKVAEVGMCVADGADEIDVVLSVGKMLSQQYDEVRLDLEEMHSACRGATLKVILETGALQSMEDIRRASILSLYAGADFLKTSTGKEYPGASHEAVYVMAQVLKEYYQKHGERRGLKISGGVRTAQQALEYYAIVREVLGTEWLTPELLRIGASAHSLPKDLAARVLGE